MFDNKMSQGAYEHIFSENSKESLKEFIEASKNSQEYQNLNHIKVEFNKWKQFMKNLVEITELADLEAQELVMLECSNTSDLDEFPDQIQVKNSPNNEVTENKLSPYYLVHITQWESIDNIEEIYRNAINHVEPSTILEMGNLMQKMNASDLVIQCYCRELLFKMMSERIEEDLRKIFDTLYAHQCTLITQQIIHFLKVHDKLDIFLVYLNSKSTTDKTLFSSLLRTFLETSEGYLSSRDLFLLDHFISKNIEYDLMLMVTDILYKNAMKFKDNKDYGKLLMKIVENLGPQLQSLKSQIDSILSNHTSIWKIKIKKRIEKMTKKY